MQVHVLTFEPRNTDGFVEVFMYASAATKRAAEIANEYTDEDEVREAFESGDYEGAIDLFVEECNSGADHSLSIVETTLNDSAP